MYNSIQTLLTIANELGLNVHQMGIRCALLQGELGEEIYMQQLEGFIDKDHLDKVCRLCKVFMAQNNQPGAGICSLYFFEEH